jgi:hypothetical protein
MTTSPPWPPEWTPRRVFLFSGHMIDAPGRETPRFPPDKEPIAAAAIANKLDELGAGSHDVGICGGACGGDLLFAEAMLARNARLEVRIPFDEPTFLRDSVDFAGAEWRARYFAVKADARTRLLVMPEILGPTPPGTDPYERENQWLLDCALAHGADRVEFLFLWNGEGGDGPGGTRHMVAEIKRRNGRGHWLDTRVLW